jgi:hypothetical protein
MDETTTDVVPTEGGEQIAPQSEPSPEGAAQDSPGGESTIEALSQEVKQLSGMVKAFQSDEDRRIPAIERQLKSQAEQQESYHKRRDSGMSQEEAQRAEVLDQIVSERIGPAKDTTVPPAQEAAPQTQAAVADYLSPILTATGLDANDADVVELLRKERDPAKQQLAIAELAITRKTAQEVPANPAAVLPSGSGQAVESETLESLSERMTELVDLPVQTPASEAERAEIRAKINKLEPIKKTIVGV